MLPPIAIARLEIPDPPYTVTVCWGCAPMSTVPKGKVVGVTEGVAPTPVTKSGRLLGNAVEAGVVGTTIASLRLPRPDGATFTSIVQEAPGASDPAERQVLVANTLKPAPPPVKLTLFGVSVTAEVLMKVAVNVDDEMPTG